MNDEITDEFINGFFRSYREGFKSQPYWGIYEKANIQSNPNSLKVEEALIIMLQAVHSFKYLIDLYNNDDCEDNSYDRNKEIEAIINKRPSDVKEPPFRITSGTLSTLLLEVLHQIYGTYYSTRNPDYDMEGELDEILELPNYSYELDSAITRFLLLPLYFDTHFDLDEDKDDEDEE